MGNKVAITGASGFIGSNLVRHLRARGLNCDASDLRALPEQGVTQVDLCDAAALGSWLEHTRPSVLFHLAARTDLLGRDLDDYRANTQGVANVIQAARRVSSIRRVVFASSRMVCDIAHIPRSYSDYCPPNAYGASKVEGERLVRAEDLPFEWVIVRPTSIWGPGFGIPYRNFFDQVWRRRYFHQRGHNPRKSFGYIGNTVWQLEQLATVSGVHGRTFYLGDYEPLRVVDWANQIHADFGLQGSIPTLPMPLLRVGAKVGDAVNAMTGRDRAPLTSFRLNNLITNMVYPQLEELAAVTGPLPFDWQTGTRNTVAWMAGQKVRSDDETG